MNDYEEFYQILERIYAANPSKTIYLDNVKSFYEVGEMVLAIDCLFGIITDDDVMIDLLVSDLAKLISLLRREIEDSTSYAEWHPYNWTDFHFLVEMWSKPL